MCNSKTTGIWSNNWPSWIISFAIGFQEIFVFVFLLVPSCIKVQVINKQMYIHQCIFVTMSSPSTRHYIVWVNKLWNIHVFKGKTWSEVQRNFLYAICSFEYCSCLLCYTSCSSASRCLLREKVDKCWSMATYVSGYLNFCHLRAKRSDQ